MRRCRQLGKVSIPSCDNNAPMLAFGKELGKVDIWIIDVVEYDQPVDNDRYLPLGFGWCILHLMSSR